MTYIPEPGVPPSRNPTHPRYRSKEQVAFGRFVAPRLSKARCFPVYSSEMTAKKFEMRAKNGGPRFYRVEIMTAIAHPRRWQHDHYARRNSGQRLIRITRDGEPLPRIRKTQPGVSGKSMWRHFRNELRRERVMANFQSQPSL